MNLTLDLSEWEKLPLTSITCRGCQELSLKMHTINPMKIDTLVIENIQAPLGEFSHHPQNIMLRHIGNIPVLPTGFIKCNGTKQIEVNDVNIEMIQKHAISVTSPMESFQWISIKTQAMKERSMEVKMEKHAKLLITKSSFPYLRPRSILFRDGDITIENTIFNILQEASIRIIADSFEFIRNTIEESTGPMCVLSPDVTFQRNTWKNDIHMNDVLNWIFHRTKNLPEQMTLTFLENTFGVAPLVRDEEKRRRRGCSSKVFYVLANKGCLDVSKKPESWIYDRSSDNKTVISILTCHNMCQDACTPPDWPSEIAIGQPICNATIDKKKMS